MPPMSEGIMIILSSPSGAGKTTLVKLLSERKGFVTSISHTTRTPRSNEVDGKDYYFVNNKKFEKMIKNNEFLEYAKVFNNFYGTTKSNIFDELNKGNDVIFDIDWQGAQKLSDFSKNDVVSVFILPPSNKELHERLKKRAEDSVEIVSKRMSKARSEISHWIEYDYVLINNNLENCSSDVLNILNAERKKRNRQKFIFDFIAKLLD